MSRPDGNAAFHGRRGCPREQECLVLISLLNDRLCAVGQLFVSFRGL